MHREAQRFGGNGPGDVALEPDSIQGVGLSKAASLSLTVCIWKVGIKRKTSILESELPGGSRWLLVVVQTLEVVRLRGLRCSFLGIERIFSGCTHTQDPTNWR